MMKRISATGISLVSSMILLLSQACSKEPAELLPDEPVKIEVSQDQLSVISSGNEFAFSIFKRLALSKPEGNLIISPLSISSALSMTMNGGAGETREAILGALDISGLSPELINQAYSDLTKALLGVDKRVILTIANSAWTEKNFVVKKPFADILTGYYDAEPGSFDITNPLAHTAINAWIEDKTNGLIKDMLDKLSPDAVMLLVNAIYFKGKWNSQFEVKNTVSRDFFLKSGSSVKVPFMRQTNDFRIYDGEGFVMAELPYGQGNFVMDVILPDSKTDGGSSLLPLLTAENLSAWTEGMRKMETDILMPRFKYKYKEKLKDVLTDLGMGIAFTDMADFSNISNQRLSISEVTHQAFIETNEEGTEAAAATVVEIVNTSMPMTFVLDLDHTFYYIIREITTNTILFMGRVDNPALD